MSLDAYRHARIVVHNARATVFEAARAMKTNDVGCVVVVGAGGRVVGVVTDRDIVLRVVGEKRDPQATSLGEVMSSTVATLPPDAEAAAALVVMSEHGIRRVPLVENGRVVGMVTLDDLLFDGAAPLPDVAAVVRAQLVEGGPARTRRFDEWQAFQRRYARADASRAKLVVAARKAAKLGTRDRAEKALWIVLVAIFRRIPAAASVKVMAQLPVLFRTRLRELSPGLDPSVTREALDAEVASELGVEPARAAEIVDAVGRILAQSTGTEAKLRQYLPRDLRSIVGGASTTATTLKRGARGSRPARPHGPAARH